MQQEWRLSQIIRNTGRGRRERINWKNNGVQPFADFFVDSIRLVRFTAAPASGGGVPVSAPPEQPQQAPEQPQQSGGGGSGGGLDTGAPNVGGGSGGASGVEAGLVASGASLLGAGGASLGDALNAVRGVVAGGVGGGVLVGGVVGGAVPLVTSAAAASISRDPVLTGVQSNTDLYLPHEEQRLLDTKATVRVYLNPMCLHPTVANWFYCCWYEPSPAQRIPNADAEESGCGLRGGSGMPIRGSGRGTSPVHCTACCCLRELL